jgi:hypothetical protein
VSCAIACHRVEWNKLPKRATSGVCGNLIGNQFEFAAISQERDRALVRCDLFARGMGCVAKKSPSVGPHQVSQATAALQLATNLPRLGRQNYSPIGRESWDRGE